LSKIFDDHERKIFILTETTVHILSNILIGEDLILADVFITIFKSDLIVMDSSQFVANSEQVLTSSIQLSHQNLKKWAKKKEKKCIKRKVRHIPAFETRILQNHI